MRGAGVAVGMVIAALAAGFDASANVGTSEVEELRSQVQLLQQTTSRLQQEMEQRRLEAERQRTELLQTMRALQAQLDRVDAGRVAAGPPPAQQTAMAASPDRPAFLDRFLRQAGVHMPERDAKLSKGTQEQFKRQTPSGQYADPTSFFFLHGYVTLTYADFTRGFGSAPGQAPQILVAGTSARTGKAASGFRNDSALFFGSELTPALKGLLEIHFVGNGRDPIITESKIVWQPVDTGEGRPSLRLVGGRYWWPFGIHNDEWFSAVNDFNVLSPAATEVTPAHINEVGVMAEGEWALSDRIGVNYLASVGNGVSSFELSDNVGETLNNQFDNDSNKTFTTRVGIFPWVRHLEVGASFSGGALRRGIATGFAVTDARRYEADFRAYGLDARYRLRDLALRSYWYFSEEALSGGAPVKRLDRNGGTLDALYTVLKDAPLFKEVAVKGRVSTATDATLAAGTFRRSQYAFGVNVRPHEHFLLKAEYVLQNESGGGIDEVKDNGFDVSGTVEF